MAVGDVYAVAFHQIVKGNPMMSIAHVREAVGATNEATIAESIAVSARATWFVDLALELSEDWSGVSIQVLRVAPLPIIPYTLVLSGTFAVVGGVVSEAVPSNSPLVVTKYTDVAAKSGRGRWYQSGIPETVQDGGQMLSSDFGAYVSAFLNFLTPLEESGGGAGRWNFAVFSRALPPQTNDVVQVTVRANLANMRPRRSPDAVV